MLLSYLRHRGQTNSAIHNRLRPSHNGQNAGDEADFCRRYSRQQSNCRSCATPAPLYYEYSLMQKNIYFFSSIFDILQYEI